ncbi:MAG: ABC transporter ATP-binding protein [Planctomycetota bacterium]
MSKHYGSVAALQDVSLEIPAGITGLLGPNGSGKSTLIKAILGLVSTQSGSGSVLGHAWPQQAGAIRDVVGYLPEDDCYIAGLSGIECVALMAELSGMDSIEALRRGHEMMDFAGFGEERYRAVESYSTGMRQKLKFAQTIVHDPPLLILDEPTTGLDPDQRAALLRRIEHLATRQGKSIVLSTHILPDVRAVCDHVMILVGGTLRVSDRLDHLSKPIEPTLHIGVVGDHARFQAAIEAANHACTWDEGSRSLTVKGMVPEQVGDIWKWASQTETAIRSVKPAVNSLEQIFYEVATGRVDASENAALASQN